ncbi:MAG TPA: urease subunit alpha, partial [Actinomycetota bacterium]|nr:urease subunit alpha [Actinomycetota bacterium]
AAAAAGLRATLETRRRVVPVRDVRGVARASLVANGATAAIEVDADAEEVRLDGRRLGAAPVAEVPLSRRYLLA